MKRYEDKFRSQSLGQLKKFDYMQRKVIDALEFRLLQSASKILNSHRYV